MQKVDTKIVKRRLQSSYLTSIISISLVLFMLGLIGFLILNARKLSNYVKENIGFTVFIKEDVKEADIFQLQKILDLKKYVKETKYITAEQAAKEWQEELGEDFVDFLGFNPLAPSIDVKLLAIYSNPDSISLIKKDLQQYSQIKEVYYQESLIHLVNENVKKISFYILGISILLFLIAFALINNTIRLAIYSKRFLIRTMQLVGANEGFIMRPFLYKSTFQGSLGALVAIVMLSAMIYFLQQELEGIIGFQDINLLGTLYGIVLFFGLLINLISTYFSVNKYLRIKTDNLYS